MEVHKVWIEVKIINHKGKPTLIQDGFEFFTKFKEVNLLQMEKHDPDIIERGFGEGEFRKH